MSLDGVMGFIGKFDRGCTVNFAGVHGEVLRGFMMKFIGVL